MASLGHLQESCGACQRKGAALLRTVEHGVTNPDEDFYDRPYRAGFAMMMSMPSHMQFKHELMEYMTVVAQTGHWINHVIEQEPDLAARIGARLHEDLGDMAERLNLIMAKGLPNREAIQAARAILEVLASAIEDELGRRN